MVLTHAVPKIIENEIGPWNLVPARKRARKLIFNNESTSDAKSHELSGSRFDALRKKVKVNGIEKGADAA